MQQHTMTTSLDIPTIVKVLEGEMAKYGEVLSGLRKLGAPLEFPAPAIEPISTTKRKYTKKTTMKPEASAVKGAKRMMSAEARQKISDAQKARWAAQKGGAPTKAQLAEALKIAQQRKAQASAA